MALGRVALPALLACLFPCVAFDAHLQQIRAPRWNTAFLVMSPEAKGPPKRSDRQRELLESFDTARFAVQAGSGGDGRAVRTPPARRGLDKDDNGQLIPPFGGGRGGDVLLHVDLTVQTLLNLTSSLQGRRVLRAQDGGASEGLANYQRHRRWVLQESRLTGTPENQLNPHDAPARRIGVPPGTVVKTQQGRFLADLVSPGDEVVVARGGEGGLCFFEDRGRGSEDVFTREDVAEITRGKKGQQESLELILRTVADVGFIGFPSAGKSTLLSRLTRARPTVGAYPFTTLIPNLGRGSETGRRGLNAGDDRERPVFVDLPGLITDAHKGKGLGRVFLRHARRCRVLLYVLDVGSSELSVEDQFRALHRELELYNPQYVRRPNVVAINKLDIPLQLHGKEAAVKARATAIHSVEAAVEELLAEDATRVAPAAIVSISALEQKGLAQLQRALDDALRAEEGGSGP